MKENNIQPQPSLKTNFLTPLWNKYFPFWPLIVAIPLLFLCLAFFYLKIATPLYQASARVIIKDESKGVDESKMIESLNLITNKKIVENEIEVLTSRSLMSSVVEKLNLYAAVYANTSWRKVRLYKQSPIEVLLKNPEDIETSKRIKFTIDTVNKQVLFEGFTVPFGTWTETKFGTIKILPKDFHAIQETESFSLTLTNPKEVTQSLLKKLQVNSSSKLSSVLELYLKGEDKSLTEEILNRLLASYSSASSLEKNQLANNTLAFIQTRMKHVGRQLDSIEHKIQAYKSKNGAVDLSSQGKLFLETVL